MKRYNFFEIFQENSNGSLSPKRTINVNGITFGPGVSFSPGVTFGGVNFHQYKNYGIAAEEENNIVVVKGFYR